MVGAATKTAIGLVPAQAILFSDSMEHLVLKPSWYVPSSIARKLFKKKPIDRGGYKATLLKSLKSRPTGQYRSASSHRSIKTRSSSHPSTGCASFQGTIMRLVILNSCFQTNTPSTYTTLLPKSCLRICKGFQPRLY
jgi:hypothetical protein